MSEIHTKTAKLSKNGAALKSLGEKSCEINGGGQEMAAMMLMLIKFNNGSINITAAISWPPPLISLLFSPRLFKAAPFFHSLAVFVWIMYACINTQFNMLFVYN